MQGKGAIKLVAALFILACIYQLSFTFVTWRVEKKAKEIAQGDPQKEADYLRAKQSEKVFLGFTYKECKEKELSLGLDLKGGMNVTLEVSVPDIVRAMSGNSTDTLFVRAMDIAVQKQKFSSTDFVSLFGESWNEVAPNIPLSRVFATYENRERIKSETSNSDVLRIIREDSESAIANSFNVLRNRIDRFGVTSPNIQRLGNSGRILVELPGVKEPERVRKLLQGTASLEFWETFENAEVFEALQNANAVIKQYIDSEKPKVVVDTTQIARVDDIPEVESDSMSFQSESDSLLAKLSAGTDSINQDTDFPLFAKLQPMVDMQTGQLLRGPVIGRANVLDTAEINAWLRLPQVRNLFDREFEPKWSMKAADDNDTWYDLIALKINTRDGKAPLDGSYITDARRAFNQNNQIQVSMSMNSEGAKIWAGLTGDNIGKSIAIVLDDYVYSYPTVQSEITGGRSEISGGATGFTTNEAEDLANVLKSGKMPAPARIIQEAVVGPSLGQASINAGFLSFALAFLLVLAYMWFYYGTGGIAANIALLTNVLLLFGALASFGAVLTLPGIAGIVLTMGMAVDANVIIYERIKEELRLGKSMRISISEGYKHAMSAILDGQLTTLLMAIVLYLFSSGPVQGFATTLGIGIVTSLATSIFISRLFLEWMVDGDRKIKFGNKFTFNFLSDTHINFLGMRKKAYMISGVFVVIALAFILTKGFSYGVDFSGGRSYVVRFDNDVSVEGIRAKISESFDESAEVKQFGPSNQMKITTKYKIDDQDESVDQEVTEKLYAAIGNSFQTPLNYDEFLSTDLNPYGITSSEKVGPTIADDMKVDSVIAILLTLLVIFIYIAIRFNSWNWGLGAVASMAHDGLLTIGLFSVCAGIVPWTMDVDQHFIAAVLTVIGYSINDTVIIFDRIRENRQLFPKRDWFTQINDAINSTLMRTINTSATVIIVLLAIFIFGGETIRGFSFSLIFGILVGVYSTIFIAIPLSYELIMKREKKKETVPVKAGKK